MRVGVIGAGRIGSFHARTLAALDRVERVTIVDVDPARAAALAREAEGDTAPDERALLADGVDALVVATPTPQHAPLTLLGVESGVPVFCEKPVALDLAEGERLARCVTELDGWVQVGFQRRFDAGIVAAREEVASGTLGALYLVRMGTHDADPPPPTYVEGPEGIYTETLVHDFDTLRFVTEREVVDVYASGAEVGPDATGLDVTVGHAVVILTLDDGAHAVVTACRHSPGGYDARLELLGSGGGICAGYDDGLAMRPLGPGSITPPSRRHDGFIERFTDAYRAEMRAFVDAVASGGPSPCTVADGVEALRIALAAWASRQLQRPVAISEVGEVGTHDEVPA